VTIVTVVFCGGANGSLQLHEYPKPMVRLACEKCGRAGQYRKENLIKRFGADIGCRICAKKFQNTRAIVRCMTRAWFATLI
jgi:hypothetical protein